MDLLNSLFEKEEYDMDSLIVVLLTYILDFFVWVTESCIFFAFSLSFSLSACVSVKTSMTTMKYCPILFTL